MLNESWTEEQKRVWDMWYSSRPQKVKEVIDKKPPFNTYIMNNGQHCKIHSYDENIDGSITLSVIVTKGYNLNVQVFGVQPESLRIYKGENN